MINDTESGPRVFVIVLAAGESRRFGQAKQLAHFGGEPLVRRAARAARECCGVNSAIVTGYRAWEVLLGAENQCQFALINDRYSEGIGSSIALAARTVGRVADALLLTLADQPLITSAHLQSLIATWSGNESHIVASRYDGVSGPPILLPRNAFPLLCSLSGDTGARALLADRRFEVTRVDVGNAGLDVDIPEDLERLNQEAAG